jgi:hypothetical protein
VDILSAALQIYNSFMGITSKESELFLIAYGLIDAIREVLPAYGNCCLAHVNLVNIVKEDL